MPFRNREHSAAAPERSLTLEVFCAGAQSFSWIPGCVANGVEGRLVELEVRRSGADRGVHRCASRPACINGEMQALLHAARSPLALRLSERREHNRRARPADRLRMRHRRSRSEIASARSRPLRVQTSREHIVSPRRIQQRRRLTGRRRQQLRLLLLADADALRWIAQSHRAACGLARFIQTFLTCRNSCRPCSPPRRP